VIYKIKISKQARTDKNDIVNYLAQFSITAPLKFKSELKKNLDIITKMPNIFALWDYDPRYRHVVVFGSYVLFYTVDEINKLVYVYRILHGSQDIEKIL